MVMLRLSSPADLSAASLRTDRMNRARKEAKLPAAVRNQNGPELSAREASASPAMNNTGLRLFMTLPTCLSLFFITQAMLAPPSDSRCCSRAAGPGRHARGDAS